MKSPLNIEETINRYSLEDAPELQQQIKKLDKFIWQDCQIETIEQLVTFEREYQSIGKDLGFVYDTEVGEWGSVYMEDGPMDLLSKGRFQLFADGFDRNPVSIAFMEAGLTPLETIVIESFRADISGMYRVDAYHGQMPPFARCVCDILNQALSKLPEYNDCLVRACNAYDRADFAVGDVFKPGFCLTTSADLTWRNLSENRYCIHPLTLGSKARAMFLVNNNTEYQVTFLQDAQFRIMGIKDWGDGKKEYWMKEI